VGWIWMDHNQFWNEDFSIFPPNMVLHDI
jgi:hypothetical protein